MIAAILLLVRCGATKEEARQQVVGALYQWGIRLESDSLKALETRYRKTGKFTKLGALDDPQKYRKMGLDPEAVVSTASGRADAFIPPENLPGFWLERLGRFLMDRRVRDDPRFVADLLSEHLKGAWRQMVQEFSATANSLV